MTIAPITAKTTTTDESERSATRALSSSVWIVASPAKPSLIPGA